MSTNRDDSETKARAQSVVSSGPIDSSIAGSGRVLLVDEREGVAKGLEVMDSTQEACQARMSPAIISQVGS